MKYMGKVTTRAEWDGHTVTYTWIPDHDLEKYKPLMQVYGICFDGQGRILIIKDKRWQIPGGTPEAGESLEETLIRELDEEAQVSVTNIFPLGVQRVDFPGNPNKEEGELYFQARFIAEIKKLDPPQADPATGKTYARKFVPVSEIDNHIKWGRGGSEMFKDAWTEYNRIKKEQVV